MCWSKLAGWTRWKYIGWRSSDHKYKYSLSHWLYNTTMDLFWKTCLRCLRKQDTVVEIWYRSYYCISCAIETKHPSYDAELDRLREYYHGTGTIVVIPISPTAYYEDSKRSKKGAGRRCRKRTPPQGALEQTDRHWVVVCKALPPWPWINSGV